MKMIRKILLILIQICLLALPAHSADDVITVGSKKFTESFILAEIIAQLLEADGFTVDRRLGMGGTIFCYNALINEEIDIYPEYTGTLSQAILKIPQTLSLEEYNEKLAKKNIKALASLGFNNTYALVVKEKLANTLNLSTISDLKTTKNLRISLSHEFLNRNDGWLGLKDHYNLDVDIPNGIEHSLAYQAMNNGEVDLTDAYSTDGELLLYNLKILEDDLNFFPEYKALTLINNNLPIAAQNTLKKLTGLFNETMMQALNSAVDVEKKTPFSVAKEFLIKNNLIKDNNQTSKQSNRFTDILKDTLTHIKLTVTALLLACLFGIGISFAVYRNTTATNTIIYITGLLQTIPSIALLVIFIPWLGIGATPAILALFLYALLPIVRNTISGLLNVPPIYKQISIGMGLSNNEQLKYILIPLALPLIISGIKTAAVISIGTATLAAFIGAGGLGEPIVTGLALNDTSLILQGAIPAALLALITEWGFTRLEKKLILPHLLRK